MQRDTRQRILLALFRTRRLAVATILLSSLAGRVQAQLYVPVIRSQLLEGNPSLSFVPQLELINTSGSPRPFAVHFVTEGRNGNTSAILRAAGTVSPLGIVGIGFDHDGLAIVTGSPLLTAANLLDQVAMTGPGPVPSSRTRLPVIRLADTAAPDTTVALSEVGWVRGKSSSDVAIVNVSPTRSGCTIRVPGYDSFFADLGSLAVPPLSLIVLRDFVGSRMAGTDLPGLNTWPLIRCSTRFYVFGLNYSLLTDAPVVEAVPQSPKIAR